MRKKLAGITYHKMSVIPGYDEFWRYNDNLLTKNVELKRWEIRNLETSAIESTIPLTVPLEAIDDVSILIEGSFMEGVEEGKKLKSDQIKTCLNI